MGKEKQEFKVFKALKCLSYDDFCYMAESVEQPENESILKECSKDPLEVCLKLSIKESHNEDYVELEEYACALKGSRFHCPPSLFEELGKGPPFPKPSIENLPTIDLKPLPPHLRYVFLEDYCNTLKC